MTSPKINSSGPERLPALWLFLAAVCLCGCSHSERPESIFSITGSVAPIQPPPFLNGPIAPLLTNLDGFSAHVHLQPGPSAAESEIISGQLLGRAGKLVFAPDVTKQEKKSRHPAGLSYLWDVSSNTGYVLSETLQGYAPWAANVQFTNLTLAPGQAPPAKIDGRLCDNRTATVKSTKGSTSEFQVWAARELKGFPLRINAESNSPALVMTLTSVRSESPPQEIFSLPGGFTHYDSTEAMLTELAMRRQSLSHPTPGNYDVKEPAGQDKAYPGGQAR